MNRTSLFLTGFPGFLASELLPRLLERRGDGTIATCLVEPRFAAPARQRAAALGLEARVRIVEGDIRQPDLGIPDEPELRRSITAVVHLAARYDLTVPREEALDVNARGTRHVLDFAERCPGLEALHHVSTCYVSGDYAGTFTEDDFDRGQGFFNAYEESKYLAEQAVRERMANGLPVVIYRPSIVVGDSRTGATRKFDGLYFVIQWLLRQPRVALLPSIGEPRNHYVNLAPCDFVADALAHLAGRVDVVGRTFHLCDPQPPTVAEAMSLLAEATGRRIVRVPLPRRVLKGVLRGVPPVRRFVGMPAELVDYFAHPARHTCERTLEELRASGLRCPPLTQYIHRVVAFMREEPEVAAAR